MMPWRIEPRQIRDHVRDMVVRPNGMSWIASEDEQHIWQHIQALEDENAALREKIQAIEAEAAKKKKP